MLICFVIRKSTSATKNDVILRYFVADVNHIRLLIFYKKNPYLHIFVTKYKQRIKYLMKYLHSEKQRI